MGGATISKFISSRYPKGRIMEMAACLADPGAIYSMKALESDERIRM